jgi:peptidoglycan/LPS O-acetylase OafA/YrhL
MASTEKRKMSAPDRKDDARLRELDALRGLAALSVMAFHYTHILPQFVDLAEDPPFRVVYGYFGVELFFMISGFVILLTLERTKRASDFVVSRMARLYPAFWVSLLITFTIGALFPLASQHYTGAQFAVNTTMLADYLKVPDIDSVYWSLSYELGFYFSMFVLFATGQLKRIEWFAAAWLALSALFILNHEWLPHPLHYALTINNYTHLFVFGIIAYRVRTSGATRARLAILAAAAGLAFLRLTPLQSAAVLSLMAMFWLAVSGKLGFLKHPALLWLGAVSYPLYLTHQMLGYRLIAALVAAGVPLAVAQVATALAMIGLASLIHVLVEKPSQHAVKAWWKGRAFFLRGSVDAP